MEYVQTVDHMKRNRLHVNEVQAFTLCQQSNQIRQGLLELGQVSIYFRPTEWMGRCYASKIGHECIERQQPLRDFLVRDTLVKGEDLLSRQKKPFPHLRGR